MKSPLLWPPEVNILPDIGTSPLDYGSSMSDNPSVNIGPTSGSVDLETDKNSSICNFSIANCHQIKPFKMSIIYLDLILCIRFI